MAPRISVVIPCYDDGATVGDAVASVREAEPVEIVARRRRLARPGDRSPCSTSSPPTARCASLRQANAGVSRRPARRHGRRDGAVRLRPQQRRPRRGRRPGRAGRRARRRPRRGVRLRLDPLLRRPRLVVRQPPWNPWILLHSNRWAISSLYRRDGARRTSAASSDGEGYEDWDLLLGARRAGPRGVLVPRVVLHYRQHGAGRRNRGAMTEPAPALRRAPRRATRRSSPASASCARRYPLPLRTRLAYRAQLRVGLLLPGWLVPRLLALKCGCGRGSAR